MQALTLIVAIVTLLGVLAPAPADANVLCRWTGICLYLSPGFTLTVIDAETGAPLSDVYAWAEWVQYGYHGKNGPLMIQDTVSGPDGRLTFPWWGPRLGSPAGLDVDSDPAVVFFKPGHATLLVQNGAQLSDPQAMVRGFSRHGETLRLRPFRGSVAEQVEQLRKAVYPAFGGSNSDAQLQRFRAEYLRLHARIGTEMSKLPNDAPEVKRFQSSLDLELRALKGAPPR